jgi:hypothetical protein
MTVLTKTRGGIPALVRNDEQLYSGNLVEYFRALFYDAKNLDLPYHNFRHMLHVTWLCHEACRFYQHELSMRKRRDLLIAALFHDFDHSGMSGNDALNIRRAIEGFRAHVQPEDRHRMAYIVRLIGATEYPHTVPSHELDLSSLIIRDADLSQSMSVAWIQHVIFGLAREWGKKPIEVLRGQEAFMSKLEFHTEWAQKMFPPAELRAKIEETRELLELLEKRERQ